MRGEKPNPLALRWTKRGSPPHARGKVSSGGNSNQKLRITPACAGKRQAAAHSQSFEKDHPRMRGEKQSERESHPCKAGSPPHARGKDDLTYLAKQSKRITPACAGKRHCCGGSRCSPVGSPPHARGKVPYPLEFLLLCGSPPHARGKDSELVGRICAIGITPACAGKRLSFSSG